MAQWGDAWRNWAEHPCSKWDKAYCLQQFKQALLDQNSDLTEVSMNAMDRLGCWREALTQFLEGPSPDQQLARLMLQFWTSYGFHIGDSLDGDSILSDVLRHLCPPYTGPAMTLYRGELEARHKAFDYRFALAWSSRSAVARVFADRRVALREGSALVLCIEAPPETIIAGPTDHQKSIEEQEYILDTRRIRDVRVTTRLPSRP